MNLNQAYERLLTVYGPQGWWPLVGIEGGNPTKSGSWRGYHPGDYSFPQTADQCFEICAGAILTQNTAWPNVERALGGLSRRDALSPGGVLSLSRAELCAAIRPSGYYNAKAKKLRCFAEFFQTLRGSCPTRAALLRLHGVGPETADSILLYAYGQRELVVDAYTRRVLAHLGHVSPRASYEEVKWCCVAELRGGVPEYQEFHALIVEHAKRHYARQPYTDPLLAAL